MSIFNGDVTGIDLGRKYIKLIQCSRKGAAVVIKRAAVIELPDIYAEDTFLDIALDAITKNKKNHKINLSNVAIVCPKEYYSSINITLPIMPKKELISALEWEVKKASNLDAEYFNIDYYPNKCSEKQTEYLVYYAEKSKINMLISKFNAYKIKLKYIDVSEMADLACYNALYSDDGTVKGFFDFGATQSRFVIAKSGTILLHRTLSYNLKNLYETFKSEIFENLTYKEALELRGFNDPEAEKLLVNYLNDVIFEIMRSIDYFKANFKMPAPTNIFLSGGLFKIPGVFDYFKNNLAYPVTLNNVLELCGYKDEKLCENGYFFNLALGVAIR